MTKGIMQHLSDEIDELARIDRAFALIEKRRGVLAEKWHECHRRIKELAGLGDGRKEVIYRRDGRTMLIRLTWSDDEKVEISEPPVEQYPQ